jgi:hypothetical protein
VAADQSSNQAIKQSIFSSFNSSNRHISQALREVNERLGLRDRRGIANDRSVQVERFMSTIDSISIVRPGNLINDGKDPTDLSPAELTRQEAEGDSPRADRR